MQSIEVDCFYASLIESFVQKLLDLMVSVNWIIIKKKLDNSKVVFFACSNE